VTIPLIESLVAEGSSAGEIEWRRRLSGVDVGEESAALIESAEVAHLAGSHQVIPDVAVVLPQTGPVQLRTPVRPDEIERSEVVLYETGGTAELLARATLEPYFGILPTAWHREPSAGAQAVVVDGVSALLPHEGGHVEDLCRAWFILTGEPVVNHVLVAPKNATSSEVQAVADALLGARAETSSRRRELYPAAAEREGLDIDALRDLFRAIRWSLEESDRRSLLMLLQRGNKGSSYPYVWELTYRSTDNG
jgi:predicted solute-binding protein